MQLTLPLVTDLLIPLASAQFFLIIFLYFLFSKSQLIRHYRAYTVFLAVLIFFLAGRTLSAFEPIEETINYYVLLLRMFLLFAVGAPSLLHTCISSLNAATAKERQLMIYSAGGILGIAYVALRCITGVEFVHSGGELTAAESKLFYCWIGAHTIQIIMAGIFFIAPACYILYKRKTAEIKKCTISFITGMLLFGIIMVVSIISEQWWITYLGAIPCAVFWGIGIFSDITESQNKAAMLVPLIKDEIINDVSFFSSEESRLRDMLNSIGMLTLPDCFMVIAIDSEENETFRQLAETASLNNTIDSCLTTILGKNNYLIIHVGSSRMGICLNSQAIEDVSPTDIAEQLRIHTSQNTPYTISIGIGQSYGDIKGLSRSYTEAFEAAEYATKVGPDIVIRHSDIHRERRHFSYPAAEKEELVKYIKTGSTNLIESPLSALLEALNSLSRGDFEKLKTKVRDLIVFITDAAISGGAPLDQTELLKDKYYIALETLPAYEQIAEWLLTSCRELAESVNNAPKEQEDEFVTKARDFINDNYQDDIGAGDVARSLGITTSHFVKTFSKRSGQTFSQYLTEVRMQEAQYLLLEKNMSVADVAYEVGFNNANYFGTVFKKFSGMTPKQYQNSAKK